MSAKKKSKRTVKSTKSAPAATAEAKPKVNKSEFIRQFPYLSPKEVVEEAKAAGITLTANYVSTARYNARVGGKKPGAAAGGRRRRVQASANGHAASGEMPAELRGIVWKYGAIRVAEWLGALASAEA